MIDLFGIVEQEEMPAQQANVQVWLSVGPC
jgi:hypothetical protein